MKPTNEIAKIIVRNWQLAPDTIDGLIERITTALDRERARCDKMREALEFYEDAANYDSEGYQPAIFDDYGKLARAALADEEIGKMANEYAPNESDEDARFNFIMGFEKAQSMNTIKALPTQKEIDDAYVENADNADSCRSWRAGVKWLQERLLK